MSQVCMLDSSRLSSLLQDALSWGEHVSSLLVSATNGSVLAYAYRDETPIIKDIRTQSTTITTAYSMASEETLVFEAQDSGAISVITPVTDHVLLAVTSPEPIKAISLHNGHPEIRDQPSTNGTSAHDEQDEEQEREQEHNDDVDEYTEQIRMDLEAVALDLAESLKDALATMRWPDDI